MLRRASCFALLSLACSASALPYLPPVSPPPEKAGAIRVSGVKGGAGATNTNAENRAVHIGGTRVPNLTAAYGPNLPGSGAAAGAGVVLSANPAFPTYAADIKTTVTLSAPAPTRPTAPAAPTAPERASSGLVETAFVTIQAGDTLSSLSRRHGTTLSEIQRLNPRLGNTLSIGQMVAVPDRLCGDLNCVSEGGRVTAPDGSTLRRSGQTLTLTPGPTGRKTLWPELARVWVSSEKNSAGLLAALLGTCTPQSQYPQITCLSGGSVSITRTLRS